jgi:hypothetical protein
LLSRNCGADIFGDFFAGSSKFQEFKKKRNSEILGISKVFMNF